MSYPKNTADALARVWDGGTAKYRNDGFDAERKERAQRKRERKAFIRWAVLR